MVCTELEKFCKATEISVVLLRSGLTKAYLTWSSDCDRPPPSRTMDWFTSTTLFQKMCRKFQQLRCNGRVKIKKKKKLWWKIQDRHKSSLWVGRKVAVLKNLTQHKTQIGIWDSKVSLLALLGFVLGIHLIPLYHWSTQQMSVLCFSFTQLFYQHKW